MAFTELKRGFGPWVHLDWRTKRLVGRLIAAGIDFFQVVVFPFFVPGVLSPVNAVADVVAAVFFTALFGWHFAFLPTFLTELVPFVDLFPTWTIAVVWATRKEKTDQRSGSDPGPTEPKP